MTRLACFAAVFSLLCAAAPAQDAGEELRDLRKAVEQQAKQIEALAQQVAKLTAAIEGKPAPAPAAAESSPASAPAKEEFNTATAAKAEPAQPHHIVVKGETLTSIAKQYNVPLAELIKANKGINDRKIQIGQTILLPAAQPTPSATSESKPDSKPNP